MIDPFKQKALNRLKRSKGQLDGIIKMIEEDKYCIDILTQVLALHGGLKGVSDLVLESHLNTCGSKLSEKNSKTKQEFITELMKVCDLSSR